MPPSLFFFFFFRDLTAYTRHSPLTLQLKSALEQVKRPDHWPRDFAKSVKERQKALLEELQVKSQALYICPICLACHNSSHIEHALTGSTNQDSRPATIRISVPQRHRRCLGPSRHGAQLSFPPASNHSRHAPQSALVQEVQRACRRIEEPSCTVPRTRPTAFRNITYWRSLQDVRCRQRPGRAGHRRRPESRRRGHRRHAG
jgi:hypothetical protein